MIEALYHVCLGHDALDDELALDGIGNVFDLLGRPLLVEHRVERKVHRRHTAGADFGKQLIPFANNNTRFHKQPPSYKLIGGIVVPFSGRRLTGSPGARY